MKTRFEILVGEAVAGAGEDGAGPGGEGGRGGGGDGQGPLEGRTQNLPPVRAPGWVRPDLVHARGWEHTQTRL